MGLYLLMLLIQSRFDITSSLYAFNTFELIEAALIDGASHLRLF